MSIYPSLFRRFVFPALDVINRTHVARIHSQLEESQWWPRESLLDMQHNKLESMLAWTRENAAFYTQHWISAPAERRASSLHPALDGLPVVSKQDLRSALGAFPIASARPGRVFKVHTSGSTGEPMVFYRSHEQESWFWALRLRMWQWGGYQPGEPYLTLNLNPRTALRKRAQDVLFRCWYHGFNANEHDVDAVIRDLTDHRIPHLVGYASSLYLLAKAMRERAAKNPGVRTILATGDSLLPEYRHTIEEVFGVGVCDYYGAGGEGVHLASQCEERDLYHLHVENAVVEILKDGRPAKPGEIGEIVVTQLDNRAMPLIRYATQDVAIPTGVESCACGRHLPLIQGIQGRVPDLVFAPDGSCLVVHFFTILFEYIPEILQFQVVQRVPERIIARIVRTPEYDEARTERRIREAIAKATHGTLSVDFEYVEEIPLSRSRKRRFVVSEIRSAPLAAAASDEDVRATASSDARRA